MISKHGQLLFFLINILFKIQLFFIQFLTKETPQNWEKKMN